MSDGIPLMQYKVHPKSVDWLPEKGIELWKRNDQGESQLPQGVPRVLPPFEYVKENEKVVEGLKKHVNWWKQHMQEKGDQSEYAKWINPVLSYWENLMPEIQTPSAREDIGFHNFWRRSICEQAEPLDLQLEDNVDEGFNVMRTIIVVQGATDLQRSSTQSLMWPKEILCLYNLAILPTQYG